MKRHVLILALLFFAFRTAFGQTNKAKFSGKLQKWHDVTLTFQGPTVSEQDDYNPFFNYRLNVTFIHQKSGEKYVVPGYFAADGNAANTSAEKGNKWRVHFAPDKTGEWKYEVSFRKGNWVAVSESAEPGISGKFMDGASGTFNIKPSDAKGRDFRRRGRLEYVGKHYLEFAETGRAFLKIGTDAPENFLAYKGFDGNFKDDGHKDQLVKTWAPHIKDWKKGDPTWENGKGKGIIGALNYLASKGLNSVSFLTMNIKGDDRNVFPYINYHTYDRFDVSKLAQWEIVFSHADKLGIFLHFKTQETENQGLLDGGAVGAYRKLYYRELIARFAHHLALNWNLGEEDGEWQENPKTPPQFTYERRAMARYFYNHDPYHHPIVIHNGAPFNDLLGDKSKLTGPSIQTSRADFSLVHGAVLKWRHLSDEAGRPWTISVDEPGDAKNALVPDSDNPEHNLARKNALWGAFMGGAYGVEWYFGYDHKNSDLTCQNYRSRDHFWDQCRYLLQFFRKNDLPVEQMHPDDSLTPSKDDYVLTEKGKIYVIYQKEAHNLSLDLSSYKGIYDIKWFNPYEGEYVKELKIQSGRSINLKKPDSLDGQDCTILVKKEG